MRQLISTFRELFGFVAFVCAVCAVGEVIASMTLGWRVYPVGDIAISSLLTMWVALALAPAITVVTALITCLIGIGAPQPVEAFRRRVFPTKPHTAQHTVGYVLGVLALWAVAWLAIAEIAKTNPTLLHLRAAAPLLAAVPLTLAARFKLMADAKAVVLTVVFAIWYFNVIELQAYFPQFSHLTTPTVLVGTTLACLVVPIQLPRWANAAATTGCLMAALAGGWFPSHSHHAATMLGQSGVGYGGISALRLISDVDLDGYSNWFDSRDCAPFDSERHIRALEEPENGIDENCVGGDAAKPTFVDNRAEVAMTMPPKNFLLVTVDTLQARMLGFEKAGIEITPNLNKFAKRSLNFAHAFSPSTYTHESIPSLMSGTYSSDWHQSDLYFGTEATLAETLKKVHYQTFATISLPILNGAMLDGFDYVDNTLGVDADKNTTSDETTRKALEAIANREPKRPFMAWVHYFDPHASYTVIPQYKDKLGSTDRDYYLHDVIRADHAFGVLIDRLTEAGMMKNAVIVVTSDHGEGLGLNNIETHVWKATTAVTHVPLMIYYPGVRPTTIEHTVSLVDVYPTVIELLGITGTQPRDGQSIINPKSRPFFIEATTDKPLVRAVVDGNYKLVYDWQRDTYTLTNVVEDPDEYHNLIASDPERFAAMKQTLWEWWDRQYGLPAMVHRAERGQIGARDRQLPPYEGPPVNLSR